MPKPVLPTLGIAKARNFIDDQQDSGAQAAPSTRQQKQPQTQTLGTKPHLIEQPQKGPPLKHGASNIAHSGSFVAARPAGGSPSVAQKPPVPALSLTALGASSASLSARDAPLLSCNSSSASSHALITAAALQRGAMTSRAPTQPGPPPPSRLPESSCGSSSSSSGAAAASAATSLQTPHGHSTSRTPRSSSRQQQQAGAVPGGQRGGGGVAAGAYTTAAAAPKAPEGTPPALGARGGLGGSARLTPPTITTPAHTSHSTAAAAHSHPSQQTSTVSTATTTGVAPASRPVERPGAGRPGQGGGGVGAGVGTPPSTSSASASAGSGGSGAAASTAWESGSITPAQALKRYSEYLTPFEQSEILDYPSVYFVGRSGAQKVRGNPHATKGNYGYDDERGDYLIVPHDHLGYRYEVLGLLGKGSFGQVIKVHDFKANMLRAVKIIRNKKRFHHQALVELKVLQHLVGCDQADEHNIIHIKDHFTFRNHLCISFELLSLNLYEFVKQNNFVGLSLGLIRRFAHQILVTLSYLKTLRIIHCDLKPENILLRQPNRSAVKVIDFGSSCFTDEKVYTYIQSRFYRSPEVVLGLPYGCEIDMWSFGAILAELYTGSPLFPGEDEAEQLACIMEVLGPPPPDLLATASRRKLFFDSVGEPLLQPNSQGKLHLPGSRSLSSVLRCSDLGFLDLVEKCLRWSPAERITPNQALKHSWIMDNAPSPTPRNPPAAAKPHLPSQPVATLAATYLQQQQQAQQQQQQQAAQQVLALQQQQQQQSAGLQHSSRHHNTYDQQQQQQQQQQYYLQQQQQQQLIAIGSLPPTQQPPMLAALSSGSGLTPLYTTSSSAAAEQLYSGSSASSTTAPGALGLLGGLVAGGLGAAPPPGWALPPGPPLAVSLPPAPPLGASFSQHSSRSLTSQTQPTHPHAAPLSSRPAPPQGPPPPRGVAAAAPVEGGVLNHAVRPLNLAGAMGFAATSAAKPPPTPRQQRGLTSLTSAPQNPPLGQGGSGRMHAQGGGGRSLGQQQGGGGYGAQPAGGVGPGGGGGVALTARSSVSSGVGAGGVGFSLAGGGEGGHPPARMSMAGHGPGVRAAGSQAGRDASGEGAGAPPRAVTLASYGSLRHAGPPSTLPLGGAALEQVSQGGGWDPPPPPGEGPGGVGGGPAAQQQQSHPRTMFMPAAAAAAGVQAGMSPRAVPQQGGLQPQQQQGGGAQGGLGWLGLSKGRCAVQGGAQLEPAGPPPLPTPPSRPGEAGGGLGGQGGGMPGGHHH